MEARPTLRSLLTIVILLISHARTAIAVSPDGFALLEFKDALTVKSPLLDNWKLKDLMTPGAVCSWGGISCDPERESVQMIDLSAQVPRLEGKISASLGRIKQLTELRLDQNLLSGTIPPELGKLHNLTTLSLYGNNLSGEIPPQFGSCGSLKNLWLDQNMLSGAIPESLGNLEKLGSLFLSENCFTGEVPASFGNLTSLWQLDLHDNSLSGPLPPAMFQNPKLIDFSVYSNNLNGNLTTALEELSKQPAIQQIIMENNSFTGTLPPSIGNATSLITLILGMQKTQQFGGRIPPEIGNLKNLTRLGLHNSSFTGALPPELGTMTSLQSLELGYNHLTGAIPPEIGNLKSLTILQLFANNLTGPIPPAMSHMTALEGFYLHNNLLTGPIPVGFATHMPNLTEFITWNNSLSGRIPLGLSKSKKLKWLDVGYNNLEGEVPVEFGSVLEYLDLSFNKFTGRLPVNLMASSKIQRLDFRGNHFTGGILTAPSSSILGGLSSVLKALLRLDFGYTSFTEDVAVSFRSFSKLESLKLSGNNLTVLDSSLYSRWGATLQGLHLEENPWNSPIAPEIGELKKLTRLNLSYGGFTGGIPSSLQKLKSLTSLDLSHNDLTGEIPVELGEMMTSLERVNVSYNSLTGSLPPEWVKFLVADPGGFVGNPGLCLEYDDENFCNTTSGMRRKGYIISSGGDPKRTTGVTVGVVLAIALALALFFLFLFWLQPTLISQSQNLPPSLQDIVVKSFLTTAPLPLTYEDIMDATENLSEAHVIGRGCRGVVYLATMANGAHIVVKKIQSLGVDMKTDLLHESFWKEVESNGNAEHRNVVKLLGFIKCGEVGLLLYEYLCNGDLRAALHDPKRSLDLNWRARVRIAECVAHGLAYLHNTHNPPVVHRDVTSSTVLLDEDLEAKISGFGLSKVMDTNLENQVLWSATSPAVLGSHGYIAPEVGYSNVVTPKMDVYSYGVLLLELLTGKTPADTSFGESLHVVAWVQEKVRQNDGKMSVSVIDPLLLDVKNPAARDEMLAVKSIALLCTRECPADRPTMREVEHMFETLSLKKGNGNWNRNADENV